MINKEDICVIIGSYPQNHIDTTLVSLTLEGFKRRGYDTCLVSHAPLSYELQKASTYSIYSDENPTLNFPKPSSIAIFFANEHIHYQTNRGNRMGAHSLAILMNMKNALYLLKNKKYKSFVYAECDTVLNSSDHELLESKLDEIDFHNKDYWFMIENSSNLIVPVTTLFGGDIEYFHNIFNSINSEQDYLQTCHPANSYSLESLFSVLFCMNVAEKGYLDYVKPRDIFSSKWLGISNYGTISIPEWDNEFDVDLDIVKQRGGDENNIFFVLFLHDKNEPVTIKFYRDNNLIETREVITGVLHHWLYNINETKVWKAEVFHNEKLIKTVERTTEDVFWNIWSFFETKDWNIEIN
jgi:hypothetical protein